MCKHCGRARKRRAKNRHVRFGAKGTKSLEYLGDLPQDFIGVYTREMYLWSDDQPTQDVDKRDVPGLWRVLKEKNFKEIETAAN